MVINPYYYIYIIFSKMDRVQKYQQEFIFDNNDTSNVNTSMDDSDNELYLANKYNLNTEAQDFIPNQVNIQELFESKKRDEKLKN